MNRRIFFPVLFGLTVLYGTTLPAFSELLHGLLQSEISDIAANNDFANYWIAARLFLAGKAMDLFSGHDIYFTHMQSEFGSDYPWHSWSYPPHYLVFIFPLGFLGYNHAFALFQVGSLALFIFSVRVFIAGKLQRQHLLVLLPFALVNIWAGQNGFLTAAFCLCALGWRYRRPMLAGVFLGCLTIKPQLGILFPLLLMIERRWITIASAVATACILFGLSVILVGADAWAGYFQHTSAYQMRVATEFSGIFLSMMPSIFGTLRNLGVSAEVALLTHLAFAIPALAVFLIGCFTITSRQERSILVIAATFAITPYALFYDLGAWAAAVAVAVVAWHGAEGDEQPRGWAIVLLLSGLMPVLMLPFGNAGLPAAPIVVGAFVFLWVRRRDVLAVNLPA